MKTYVVLLLDRDGRPWASRQALRLEVAESPEEAVRAAHEFPPDYAVGHAWVMEAAPEGQPCFIEVDVARPEWGAVKGRP